MYTFGDTLWIMQKLEVGDSGEEKRYHRFGDKGFS